MSDFFFQVVFVATAASIVFGTLAVGLFNPDVTFLAQLKGVVVIGLFVFAASLVVWGVLKAAMGLRLSEEEEHSGEDEREFGFASYPEFVKMPASVG